MSDSNPVLPPAGLVKYYQLLVVRSAHIIFSGTFLSLYSALLILLVT